MTTMSTRVPMRFAIVLAAVAMSASPGRAFAAHGDAAAQKAADRAMNDLFMATKFEEARKALESTIEECGSDCSDKTRARLYRDLGVVEITGFHDTKKGRTAFKKARTLDPGIALDPVITTPEIQSVFDASAGGGGGDTSKVEEAAASVVLDDGSEEGGGKKKKKKRHDAEEESTEPERVVVRCSGDSDCEQGQACVNGQCGEKPPAPYEPVVWLSLGLIQDMLFVSGSDVCTQKSQVESGFTCLRAGGSQYHGTPLPGQGGKISFTPAFASTRVTLASYVPLFGPVSAGIRMGYAFAGQGPQADGGKKFVFYQAEAIAAYWLSGDAFSTKHIGTFLQASGGVAEIDASAKVKVTENLNAVHPASQFFDNPPQQTLDAYEKTGSGFASLGAGAFLPFGSASGLLADLRFSVLFPTTGVALSLGVSGMLGL